LLDPALDVDLAQHLEELLVADEAPLDHWRDERPQAGEGRPASWSDHARLSPLDSARDDLARLPGRDALTDPPRHAVLEALREWIVLEPAPDHLGHDEPEVDDGGRGAVRDQLQPQRPSELLDRGLRAGVRGEEDAVEEGIDRGHDHDLALALDDVRQRGANRAPHTHQVHVDDLLEDVRLDD